MKIAYVTTYNSSDIHSWSGTGYYMFQALKETKYEIEQVILEKHKYDILFKLKNLFYRFISKKYLKDRDPKYLSHYAKNLEEKLSKMDYDVIFSPSSIPLAYLETEKPMIFWTDATFDGIKDFYPEFSNLADETIRDGHIMEQMALSKSRFSLYSSDWARDSALEYYEVDENRVITVPFGANIDSDRELKDIESIVKSKKMDRCNLLFSGVDWDRKGGDMALSVAEELTKRGIKTELHIVGVTPDIELPDYVTVYGFVSKSSKEGKELLDSLMMESHFLIVPSKAECAAMVFAEASSFGLPSISRRVGGIPTVIEDDINGKTFDLNDKADIYCDYIEDILSSKERYQELSISSFHLYNKKLNWTTASERIKELLDTI